jgi:HK97 family phage major capsid protein
MSAIVEVVSEPLTYREDAGVSYFKDLVDAERGDYPAAERLRRHGCEIADEMERRDTQAASGVEYRTSPNRTTGQGGNFAPPLWIIDRFATAPRAKRVLADLIPNFPLPQGVQSVNLPRLTTGNTEQAVADLAADPSADAVDAAVTCEVVTVSGHGDVALQLLDQSPPGAHLDWAFFKDLSEAYDANLEFQLINGSTSAGQLPGMLGLVPSANQVTYTAGSPTATGMFGFLGQVLARIGDNRKQPPEAWLMTTSRMAWLGSSEDSQNRPLMIADRDGDGSLDLLAFPVKLDDAIPVTLGAGGNQDALIACRPSDSLLLESAPRARVHLDVLSGSLQARIQLHCYVAVLHRYPSGMASLTGTGLVVQSGF